tara:strand:+ start:13993 stop:14529 length:537 start_codon:yes stop_codon:yes gene_type:complete
MLKITKTVALLIGLLLTNFSVFGQSDCNCCESNYNDFNFWIGQWEVFDTSGNKVGDNRIRRIEGGCALQENWTGTSGVTGQSMNYYDSADSTWNQLWVSSSGTVLKLKGGLVGKEMIMKSDLVKTDSTNYYHEIKWSQVENSSDVIQEWTTRKENGDIVNTLFKGRYVREISEPIKFR